MRKQPKSIWGWIWILGFLTLPDCDIVFPLSGPGNNLSPGDRPHSSIVFCDIEDKSVARRCATPEDLGVSLSGAAIALTRGESSHIGFDFSVGERAVLGCGAAPVAIFFKGSFPKGTEVCLNCGGVIGPGLTYEDANAACVAKCLDLNGEPEGKNPAADDVKEFCAGHAVTSTNAGTCFDGACTDAGNLRSDFTDPREVPEPVAWTNRLPDEATAVVSGADSNTLTRNRPSGAFDVGAASVQLVTRGDAYVEFTADQVDKTRAVGFAGGAPPDGDPTLNDIRFAVSLSSDGHVFAVENGVPVPVPPPNPDGSVGTYQLNDRLRVTLTDNHDGTVGVTYSLIPASCRGPRCDNEMVLFTSTGPATYPFRVDASLRDDGARLTDVRIVRIK